MPLAKEHYLLQPDTLTRSDIPYSPTVSQLSTANYHIILPTPIRLYEIRFQVDRVYVYDPSRCSMAFLRPFKCVELAQTGDSIKCQSIVETTFVMHNEKSAAKCKKCATD